MAQNLAGKVIGEAQVVVIGAGVIGCSIAYHLARRDASVTVIDTNGIATGTSSATLGLVWVQRKEPAEYMELNLLSSKLHAELARTFDEDVELNQPGGIATYVDENIFKAQLANMNRLNAASELHQARAMTASKAHQLEPAISLGIVGAIYCPHDGEINPIRLVFNLASGARKFGASFIDPNVYPPDNPRRIGCDWSSRNESPLTKASDAVEVDTTNVTIDGQVNLILEEVKKVADKKNIQLKINN